MNAVSDFPIEAIEEVELYQDFLHREFEEYAKSLVTEPAPARARWALGYDVAQHPVYSKIKEGDLLKKSHLRADPDAFDSYLSESETHWVTTTSGTSGPAVEIRCCSRYNFIKLFQSLPRTWLRFARTLPPKDPVFSVFFTDNSKYSKVAYQDPTATVGLQLVYPLRSIDPSEFGSFLTWASENPVPVLSTKPNLLKLLVDFAKERPSDLRPKWTMIVSSGASLDPELRDEAESVFSASVVSSYNTTEAGFVGSQCSHRMFHIDGTLHEVEVLKDCGEIADAGEGDLVLTSYANDCMPLRRFLVGDRVSLHRGRCDCGQPGAYLSKLLGRTVPIFDLGEGIRFSPTIWMKVFERFPELTEFQMTQKQNRKFEVRLEVNGRAERLEERLSEFFLAPLKVPVEFEYELTTFDRNQKFSRYRSEVTQ